MKMMTKIAVCSYMNSTLKGHIFEISALNTAKLANIIQKITENNKNEIFCEISNFQFPSRVYTTKSASEAASGKSLSRL